MYPEQQKPVPPPPNDPFAFITQKSPEPKRSAVNLSSKRARILLMAGFVLLLIVAAVVVFTILGSGDKQRTQNYIEIAQQQTEIIRLTALADSKAKNLETRSKAVTTKAVVTTAQKEMITVINKRGVKEKELTKELSGKKNTKSDELLKEAEKNNRYDETFIEILDAELANYKKQLNQASAGAKKSDFKILENAYTQVATIETPKK